MTIKSDSIYEHDTHGEVLVVSIVKHYEKWPQPDDQSDDSTKYVYYHTRWDKYGGMSAWPMKEEVDTFDNQSSFVRAHDSI